MIIFYDKNTGRIVGSIAGRVNSADEMKMWVGDPKTTERVVITWKPVKEHRDLMGRIFKVDFEPDHSQKEIMGEIEKNGLAIYDYDIDLKDKKLIKKRVTMN